GFSYHNMRQMGPGAKVASTQFDHWLQEVLVAADPRTRSERLRHWTEAPSARAAHPMEDHLIPLMVAVGAAEDEGGTCVYHEEGFFGGVTASSFRFGSAGLPRS